MNTDQQLELVERLAADFAERIRLGEQPSIEEYERQHPDHAEIIRDTFEALALMEDLAPRSQDSSPQIDRSDLSEHESRDKIGDFRIIRMVGRGGMGIVYEAEQVSLGRHVALKVLPQSLLDNDKLRMRFQREARAAAKLHHTNIVPVFGVGDEDGAAYYAMQFIQGLSLDQVLEEIKRLQAQSDSDGVSLRNGELRASRRELEATNVARSLMSGVFEQESVADDDDEPDPTNAEGEAQEATKVPQPKVPQPKVPQPKVPQPKVSSRDSRLSDTFSVSSETLRLSESDSPSSDYESGKTNYWRSVARIGFQVADALEYAHTQGILHRDIKPANLLLDMRGTVWVTDFGLAKLEDDRNLTQTGDILGTLRYMAPETFKGNADARSEIYSLGLTLYELVALRPAFDQTSRSRLVDQVMKADVPTLKSLNPEIPRDLQTIIHKAIQPDLKHRYVTAGELGDDLRRFAADEPILARQLSHPERLRRWSRHNRGLAASLALVALLSVTILVGAIASSIRYRNLAEVNGRTALRETAARISANEARREAEAMRNEAVSAQQQEKIQRQKVESLAFDSLLGEMRARRLAGAPGYRDEITELIRQAQQLPAAEEHVDQLRTELVASMGDPLSVHPMNWRQTGRRQPTFNTNQTNNSVAIDGPCRRVLRCLPQAVQIRSADDGTLLRQLRTYFPTPATVGQEIMCWLDLDGNGLVSSMELAEALGSGERLEPLRLMSKGGRFDSRFAEGLARFPNVAARFAANETFITRSLLTVNVWQIPAEGNAKHLWTLAPVVSSWTDRGGRYLAITRFNRLEIWEIATQQKLADFAATEDPLLHVAICPTGQRVAMVVGPPNDSTLIVRNLTDRREEHRVEVGRVGTRDVLFSQNGSTLAVLSEGGVQVFDVSSYDRIFQVRDNSRDADLGPYGRVIAVGNPQTGKVRVWNVATNHLVSVLDHFNCEMIRWSSDGDRLMTASAKTVKLWNLSDTPEKRVLRSHRGGVAGICYSRDGNSIASTGKDRTIKIWNAKTGKVERTFNELMPTPGETISYGADGNLIACGDYRSGAIRVFDANSGTRLAELAEPSHNIVWSTAFSPDGHWFAATGSEHTRLWRVSQNDDSSLVEFELVHELDQGLGRGSGTYVNFSPDSNFLGWARREQQGNTLRVWSLAESRIVAAPESLPFNPLQNLSFTPDSQGFWFINQERTVEKWSVDGDLLESFPGPVATDDASYSCKLMLSPDGKLLAISNPENSGVTLWDPYQAKQLATLRSESGAVWELAWSPDSNNLAIAFSDSVIELWDLARVRESLGDLNLNW